MNALASVFQETHDALVLDRATVLHTLSITQCLRVLNHLMTLVIQLPVFGSTSLIS
jgi:hypothetical protein